MTDLAMLIKPVSGKCNMNCQYCFYQDVIKHRAIEDYGYMSLDTVKQIVEKSFESARRHVSFMFQGGEPTLRGLDFYESFIACVKRYNHNGTEVSYALQTNGVLIDQQWVEFFKANHFLVGLSLDGPKPIHDINRRDCGGNDTFVKVEKAAQLLNKQRVEFNILCVVTKNVAKHAGKVYGYFKKSNFLNMQFIPCLDELEQPLAIKQYSLLPQEYGQFLCELFDLWYRDFISGIPVSIRMFDNIVQMLLGYPPESCDMNGRCSVNAVIEADGSLYPCDFYVLDKWCLGNIEHTNIEALKDHPVGKQFVQESLQKPTQCMSCQYISICRTGCRRHKQVGNENYFCTAYKRFYGYTLERFKEIAAKIYRQM
jgi:uncharacterized protein